MLRELFRIPGLDLPIYSFGLMLVLGCFLAMQLAQFLARRSRINADHFVNVCIIALIAGVIGARASHVFENWHYYFGPTGKGLGDAINIRTGGLTYYGGVMLATPCCIAYGLWRKIPLRRGMDIIAPCLMIGLGLGRVGCFMNGCCWGATCDAPWAVTFPYDSPAYEAHVDEGLIAPPPAELKIDDPLGRAGPHWASAYELSKRPDLAKVAAPLHSAPVHPSQLYSTAAALTLAAVLVAFYTLAPVPGRVFALMMILEGVARFTIETLRVEPAVMKVGGLAMSYSMVVGALLFVAGVVAWFAFGAFDRDGRGREESADETNAAACVPSVG